MDSITLTSDTRVLDKSWRPDNIPRHVCSTNIAFNGDSRTELDSHADSPCVGHNTLVVSRTGKSVYVNVALPSMGSRKAPIITAAVTYDAPDGEQYVVIINQAIYFEELQHNLIGTNMVRMNDVDVNDRPKSLTTNPSDEDHALVFKRDGVTIPLLINGVISYFPTRKTTWDEYNNLPHLHLTAESPEWDPHSDQLQQMEASITDANGNLRDTDFRQPRSVYLLNRLITCSNPSVAVRESMSAASATLASISSTLLPESLIAATKISRDKYPGISPERLAKNWRIGLEAAKRTVQVTTQRGVRTILHPNVERRFRTSDRQLRYKHLNTELFTDTMFSKVKSTRQNTCAQLYVNDLEWQRSFPMRSKAEAHETFDLLCHRHGAPKAIISDGAKEVLEGEFRRKARAAGVHLRQVLPYSPFMNRAESAIRENKKMTARLLIKYKAPQRLWDYCSSLVALIQSNTAHDLYQLDGQVPDSIIKGETADISRLAEFEWFQWVKFYDDPMQYPEPKVQLGKYLGPAMDVHPIMSFYVLRSNGTVVVRNTLRSLTHDEWHNDAERQERSTFLTGIHESLGPAFAESDLDTDSPHLVSAITPEFDPYEPEAEPPEADDFDEDAYDAYISAQVMLPRGDRMEMANVRKRKRDDNGNPIGRHNANPILDTRMYEVEFPDGDVAAYTANIIAENLYSQVDEEGKQYLMLDCIVDHKSDGTATTKDGQWHTVNGRRCLKRTTKGWKLCIQWIDGSTSWEPLRRVRESNPVQVAEYAVTAGIDKEPAFIWWVNSTLRRRDRIIKKINTKYQRTTHKFGIELPKTVEEALAIDKKTGTTLWRNAILKEMKNVRKAFRILEGDDERPPPDYQEIGGHLVFDIKLGSLIRKARYVAEGHRTDPPSTLTYSSVVSRDTVRLALTIAALNDLDVLTADIQNAYLNAPTSEKYYIVCGLEFGEENVGKKALIVRALYGMKSSGASF